MDCSTSDMLRRTSSRGAASPATSIFYGLSWGGIFVAFYLLSTFFDFLTLLPGVSPARLMGIGILCFFCFKGKVLRFRIDVVTASFFSLMVSSLACLLFLDNPASGIDGCFSLLLNIAILLLARSMLFTERDFKLWEVVLVIGALLMAMLIFMSPGTVEETWTSDRIVVNIGGSQQDPNEFNGYLIFAVAFFTYRAVKSTRYWLLAPVVLLIYVSMSTGSRGGLIALSAACLFAVFFGWKDNKHRMVTMACVAFVLLIALANFDMLLSMLPPSVAERFTGASLSTGTSSSRINAWGDVLSAFWSSNPLEMLFGHGFGATTRVTFNGLVAHNSFIEMLYCGGVCGLILYVVPIAALSVRMVRRGHPIETIALLGFCVLLCTLSSMSLKAFWSVLLISAIADGGLVGMRNEC